MNTQASGDTRPGLHFHKACTSGPAARGPASLTAVMVVLCGLLRRPVVALLGVGRQLVGVIAVWSGGVCPARGLRGGLAVAVQLATVVLPLAQVLWEEPCREDR